MFDTQIFAERLKAARNNKCLSQAELAKAVGVSTATISSYETPTRTKVPSLDKTASIASFLDVSIDYLCGGTTPTSPITDFNLATYLRGLVTTISEAASTKVETIEERCIIDISHPDITRFIARVKDLLAVYRAGSLTLDLYLTCVEKVIADVCKNHGFDNGVFFAAQ